MKLSKKGRYGLIERVNHEMREVLDNTTLKDLVQEYQRYEQSDMYYI